MSKISPLLQQYFSIREAHPNALLLFQVGDFYELFFEDAQKASAFLGIALTKRGTFENRPIPLCGVPVHSLDHHLIKLIKGGFKVALCDQLEEARAGKIVQRGVTQVLTPGTLTDLRMLEEKKASYCIALAPQAHGTTIGLAAAELLTGQIFATTIEQSKEILLEAELARFAPDEIIVHPALTNSSLVTKLKKQGYYLSFFDPISYEAIFSDWLQGHPQETQTLVRHAPALSDALLLLVGFLKQNQERALPFCSQLFVYSPDDYLILDAATQKNLELFSSTDAKTNASLFNLIDHCATAMGSRLLKKWLARPQRRKTSIQQRQNAIKSLKDQLFTREKLIEVLYNVGDLERIVGRIILRKYQHKDLLNLKQALAAIEKVKVLLADLNYDRLLEQIHANIFDSAPLLLYLQKALSDDPDSSWHIRPGYNEELDQIREHAEQGTQAIAVFENEQKLATGINSLKVKFNRIQGYTIELTKTQSASAPEHYVKLQTLVNATRYTTAELQQLEFELTSAEEIAQRLDQELFEELITYTISFGPHLRRTGQQLAILDALLGLTITATTHNWIQPEISEGGGLQISQGKHPVVSAQLGAEFVPNNTTLSQDARTWIITGPNMGGKSTYLRQVALIVLLAHIGSFVPASYAQIPLTDRIFTRIGASDNVTAGKSTFLVEMEETATICNHGTAQSLVILDEVGRGTSTYDGLAIAQAVLEYLHHQIQAKVLFATHFHELTTLTTTSHGIVAYHAASIQTSEGILLLHKIEPGCAEGSFGIEVARQANLPTQITRRAQELLNTYTQHTNPV